MTQETQQRGIVAAPMQKLKDLITQSQATITAVAPKHLNAERLSRLVATACQRNPKLLECAPVTVVGAILTAAAAGLEVEDGTGRAYLVPFHNKQKNRTEAQLMVGYRGYVTLMHNAGGVKRVDSRVVHKKDVFAYELGTHPKITHKPSEEADPGPLTHVYMVVEFENGGIQIEVMNVHEVEKHRRRSRGADSGPWKTDYDEMARKTVVRKGWKMVPVSTEKLAAAAQIMELDAKASVGKAQDMGMVLDPSEKPTPEPIDTHAEKGDVPQQDTAAAARGRLQEQQPDPEPGPDPEPPPPAEPADMPGDGQDPLDEEPAAAAPPPPPPAQPAPKAPAAQPKKSPAAPTTKPKRF